MKALLRSSILALVVFAGYAAFSTPTAATSPTPGGAGFPVPCNTCSR